MIFPLPFKYYVQVSRSSKALSFEAFLKSIMKAYKLEKMMKVMKGRENYLQKNRKQFCKICKTLRNYEVSFLKNQLYYKYYNCIQNSAVHLEWGFLL